MINIKNSTREEELAKKKKKEKLAYCKLACQI